jgi:hypothetical protein
VEFEVLNTSANIHVRVISCIIYYYNILDYYIMSTYARVPVRKVQYSPPIASLNECINKSPHDTCIPWYRFETGHNPRLSYHLSGCLQQFEYSRIF